MPADTLQDMVLGFAVIFGCLLSYVVSLIARTHKAKAEHKTTNNN